MSTTLFHHILSLVVKELEPHSKNSLWILTNLPKPMLMQNITGNMELKYLLNMDLDLNNKTLDHPHMDLALSNPHMEANPILVQNPHMAKGSPKLNPMHLGCMR